MSEPVMRCPVYAIGPMTGRKGHNFSWWSEVAEWCLVRGYHFLDARNHCGGTLHMERHAYMRESLRDALNAQSIILHPEWTDSAGAWLEWLAAYELGLDVYRWPAMTLWPRDDQDHAARLGRHALAAIVYARLAGGGKHGVDSYLAEPLSEHIVKGARHALTFRLLEAEQMVPDAEDHLALAICRMVMARALTFRSGTSVRTADITYSTCASASAFVDTSVTDSGRQQ